VIPELRCPPQRPLHQRGFKIDMPARRRPADPAAWVEGGCIWRRTSSEAALELFCLRPSGYAGHSAAGESTVPVMTMRWYRWRSATSAVAACANQRLLEGRQGCPRTCDHVGARTSKRVHASDAHARTHARKHAPLSVAELTSALRGTTRWRLPKRFHPQFRDTNRRDIGKSQSK
jgi:hypothetical protein